MIKEHRPRLDNKTIPDVIFEEARVALSHFPELDDYPIEFRFTKNIRKSTMQAQPTYASFLKRRKYRSYIILMSEKIQIDQEEFTIRDIPSDVVTGWLGHELGHVMDYKDRGRLDMLWFGFKYLYSHGHIKEVERTADIIAIAHGMGDYILKTKNFILDHAQISEKYKARIRAFYMSPEEVMQIINNG